MRIGEQIVLKDVYAHLDGTGRIYFDTCRTDEEHIFAPTPPGDDRRRCRTWMRDLLPHDSIGRKGTFKISIEFVPEET